MPWTAPKTWTSGYLYEEDLNTHVRDNLNYLYNPPSCAVFNNAAISIPNATWTALTFNSERWDPAGLHSIVTNTGRITALTGYAGEYNVGADGYFSAVAGGAVCGIRIGVNIGAGGAYIYTKYIPTLGAGYPTPIEYGRPWRFSVNDYATVEVYQDSGVARNFNVPEFWMQWRGG